MLIVEGKIDLALSSGCLGTETYMRAYQLQVQGTREKVVIEKWPCPTSLLLIRNLLSTTDARITCIICTQSYVNIEIQRRAGSSLYPMSVRCVGL